MARFQVQARSIGGAQVPSVQDLLRQAIQAGDDFARLDQLRGDVVKVLAQQGLAYRAHPRDKRLHVRPH